MDPLLFLGSLVAILALAGLARWLGLGGVPKLASEDEARKAASEAVDGFTPVRIGLDRAGQAALLQDCEGRLLLLKAHGNFFAGRTGGPGWRVRHDGERLTIDSGERRFGAVSLVLDEADYWAAAIKRLGGDSHA
jgi:hypothetical protein